MPGGSDLSFPVLLSSRRSALLFSWVLNRLGDDFSGCTQLVILDLKKVDADSAIKELLDSAQENGIDPNGLELIGVECDVASEESVKNAFDQTSKRFGRVDAVVASAGTVIRGVMSHTLTSQKVSWRTILPWSESKAFFLSDGEFVVNCLHRYPFDRARKLFDINVHGAYLTAREAAKIMIPNGGGSIILIASMSASASPSHSRGKWFCVTTVHPDHQRSTSKIHFLAPRRVTDGLRTSSCKRPTMPQKPVRFHAIVSERCYIHLL